MKSTNTFKGLLSWLCLLTVLCSACVAAVFAVMVLVNPGILEYATTSVQDFASTVPPSLREYYNESSGNWEYMEAPNPGEGLVYEYGLKIGSAVAILLTQVVLIFSFRRDRRAFEDMVGRGLGRIWMEPKLAVLWVLGWLCFSLLMWGGTKGIFLTAVVGVMAIYFLCLDIGRNHRFFGHNIIHSILVRVNGYHSMTTFQQRAVRRVYATIAIVMVLVVLGLVGYGIAVNVLYDHGLHQQSKLALTIPLTAGVAVIGTVWWYILALKRDLQEWNLLMDQITEMYGGDLNAVNHVSPASNLYDCAMQLNMIRTGVQKAVEEGTKADRTKIELITNVSHDIKTPLTSVISYVELLKKEPGLPDAARDYVNILSQKTQRLSGIVQDVFEVSKAATGNISLNLEDLDIGRLLQQTFAEMDEAIQRSQLQWRVDIPDASMIVHADGQRLYRVFQNLVRNCIQYSLEGSRVYVTLSGQSGVAQVSIRNVSRSEITMNGEDLTARFVRGDQNRTTEGSGLGLSIAKSFTEACGGHFFVRTDGDLFTATVQLPLAEAPGPG
ncbi:sensor histidine kinase [Acutalibacter caecimuris]|uniref:sensor histidine kinase n=1 Tax=Acutalibacter caecimuris TaxID=3093657 RepID=UPI002AC9E497|nr:HAMP domain-containing sensor histidine kinase [Acutalibacter sp. M00118]